MSAEKGRLEDGKKIRAAKGNSALVMYVSKKKKEGKNSAYVETVILAAHRRIIACKTGGSDGRAIYAHDSLPLKEASEPKYAESLSKRVEALL